MSINKPTNSCYTRTPLLYYVAIQCIIVNMSALFLTIMTVGCCTYLILTKISLLTNSFENTTKLF